MGTHSQGGYALLVVMLVFLVLAVGGSQLFTQSRFGTTMSGQQRDHREALMLAESAMNHLFGRLVTQGDIAGNSGTADTSEIETASLTPDAMSGLPLSYLYFIRSTLTTQIRNAPTPGVLQRVANGEANAVLPNIVSGAALVDTDRRIQDLFGNSVRPRLYVLANNALRESNNTWTSETSVRKAAVWVEVTRDPADPGAVDFYVQSVAQVGRSLAYTQRYLGAISTGIPDIATMAQSCDAC